MNLKRVGLESRMGESYISLNKAGTIAMSAKLSHETKITAGKFLRFHTDEEQEGRKEYIKKTKDWYFSINDKDGDVTLRSYSKLTDAKYPSYMGNNSQLVAMIKADLNMEHIKKSIRVPVGTPTEIEGVLYYPLITAKLLQDGKKD